MACLRIVEYFHGPFPREFADYVLQQSRLRGIDLEIAQNYLADEELDTSGYAQLVHLNQHNFSQHCGTVFRAIMRVIIQLAVEMWQIKCAGKQ